MTSPVKLYQQEMHDNLGFFATWLPGDPIEIGDAGLLVGGRFRRMTSLKELGIPFEIGASPATQKVEYTSTKGAKLTASGGAKVEALARAEITIEFSRAGAFVFHASSMRPQRLENRLPVAEQLVKAYKEDRWDKDWLLVEALQIADRATIVVAEDSSAGLVLVADVAGLLPAVSLADPKISFTVASTRGKIAHVVSRRRLHPLYSCLRLNDRLFGAPSVQPVRGPGDASAETAFSRPAIVDLLNS
jgi:hypothetical protein